jgi:hypothetical protein
VPEKSADPPLLRPTDPETCVPRVWDVAPEQVIRALVPALTTVEPVSVPAASPAPVNEQLVAVAGLLPVFERMSTHVPPVQFTEVALICAVAVNVPNRPNTNPAMAMAAINVIAMRMTVVRSI